MIIINIIFKIYPNVFSADKNFRRHSLKMG